LSPDQPFEIFADYLKLSVRLTPNGGRNAIDGIERDADGAAYLKARVKAVPEKGRANKALTDLIAKALKLPKSSVTVISGDTARKKILRIDGDPEDLMAKLQILLEA